MQLSHQRNNIRIVKPPLQGDQLWSLIRNLTMKREEGKQQIHPRYETLIKAQISVVGRSSAEMTIRNLSISGAYVEYEGSDVALTPGDPITIKMSSSENKSYQFNANVVWARPMKSGQGLCMGVSFINKNDELNKLLAKL
jgi:hypothetical protein